ncbi:transposase [Tunturibacter empetritectus]|uniref:transposase n=1 Tax=Tunturiibacter empetritectus TaxID=3069691 RepID=UPI00160A419D
MDSAQQIIAEVGAKAAIFPSAEKLSSWVGACPGKEESAGVNRSRALAKGQPPDAPHSQSSCECCCQTQGKCLVMYQARH